VKYSIVGIDNTLLERHSFRQTQTALTAYYFVKDGIKLAYETPVFGYPWTFPMEFPLYQIIVAKITQITDCNLEIVGRCVSYFFFCLCVFYSFLLAKKYTKNSASSLILLCFIALYPIYLYWSRTFMIESTALFFSLMWFFHSLEYLDERRNKHLVFGVIGGIFAGMVKITTFMPLMIFLFFFVIWRWYKETKLRFNMQKWKPYIIMGSILFLIPVIFIKLWTNYADNIKSMNELTKELCSQNLTEWNFGTLQQKLSFDVWKTIITRDQISSFSFIILLFGLASMLILAWRLKLKYRTHITCCLFLYFFTPLIFTNLHYRHDYYTYANSLFLCTFIGFIVLSLFENGEHKRSILYRITGLFSTFIILIGFLFLYKQIYYKAQQNELKTEWRNGILQTCNYVKRITEPEDVIMVYGNDYGGEYAYYSQRKSISLSAAFQTVEDSDFQYILNANKNFNINTLIYISYDMYNNDSTLRNDTFLNSLVSYMNYKLVYSNDPFYIYQRETKK
jgi:hypothetical protein